jgi:hypothetical protein
MAVAAQTLIIALLVGGLPLFTGVIVTRTNGAPALTLNICNPLPGLNQGAGFPPVPLVHGQPNIEKPDSYLTAYEVPPRPVIRAGEPPDPPPPKPLG